MSTTRLDPIATTSAGRVRGIDRGDHAAFLGIPYAAPPVGVRRFAAPGPVPGWRGVRETTQYGPTPQRRPFGETTTVPEPSIPGEDTLSVNVFTPAAGRTDAGLPVLVWVHGGGYFAGSPASPWYDGAAFARSGVVVVTLSYRLGFDGFGWIEDAPPNRGILDQLRALEWVRENIASFGGDPDRVTIAGQSAGGGSVLTLMTSPRARGLFRAVISQSGAPGHLGAATAEEIGRRFAADRGVAPTLAGWRGVPEDTVLDHERAFNHAPGGKDPGATPVEQLAAIGRDPLAAGLAFAPVVDGDTVVAVDEAIAAGVADDVALLLGTTRNEFAFPTPTPTDQIAAAFEAAHIDRDAAGDFFAEVERVGAAYAGSQLAVLSMFRAPATQIARARSRQAAGRTWLYDFAYRSPVDGLAAHCYELPFCWDLLGADGVAAVLGAPPQTLADRMHTAWVEFITTGGLSWPATAQHPTGALVFDEASGFRPDAYRFEAAALEALVSEAVTRGA
ncbi:MAG: carboxylesterase family protein [Microbacterium sp.]